jgi:modulator of FtsH protease
MRQAAFYPIESLSLSPSPSGLGILRGVNAYVIQGWESFFVAEAGAAAALAGLLFVAISINLTRILSFPGLPGRAAEAILILFFVLVIASLGLVPGQSATMFGAEILGFSGLSCLYLVVLQIRDARKPEQKRYWVVTRAASSQLATLPLIVAGISMLARAGGGLYWLVPGFILSFSAALLDAWVLMVEILR